MARPDVMVGVQYAETDRHNLPSVITSTFQSSIVLDNTVIYSTLHCHTLQSSNLHSVVMQFTCEPQDGLRDDGCADDVADIVILFHGQLDANLLFLLLLFLFILIVLDSHYTDSKHKE